MSISKIVAKADQQPMYGPTVTIPLGKIEGHLGVTVNNKPFYKFEGVPYAKPPVGKLRFEKARDPKPWTGIWKANILTHCMQYDNFEWDIDYNYVVHGDEDCLYVNIYTHSTNQSAKFDVLMHIHGGAFMYGRGDTYGPEIIMDRNVVFVNFNYRLGPLGFLSTEDKVLPGNLGLRDQIKALQWVKSNIKYFGGNPESITLHGFSAGGASVHLHYLIPASRGLFKQGISQSGSALNPWVLVENTRQKTVKVANIVGCPTGSSQQIKNCLKSKPARHIMQAVKEFQPFLYNPFSPFGVSVDGYWTDDPVLPDHPYKLIKNGKVQDLPWMVSYTTAEGLYPGAQFWSDDVLEQIDSKWNEISPFILQFNDSVDPELRDDVCDRIRRKYLGDRPINKESFSQLIDTITDRLYVADISSAARIHSAAVKSNIYSYNYAYRGTMSITSIGIRDNTNIGVSHGDDVLLILKMKFNFPKDVLSTEDDKLTSKLLLDMTVSFMKNGRPNITRVWEPLSKKPNDSFNVLIIKKHNDLRLKKEDQAGQSRFWKKLPLAENDRLFATPRKDF